MNPETSLSHPRTALGSQRVYPTFVVIGAMRSGTTSFHHLLASHPKIFMSSIKGPGLFLDPDEPISYPSKYASIAAKRAQRTDEELLAVMREGYRDEPQFGESSDAYSRYPAVGAGVPAKMLRFNPSIQLIYLLRNPIDRIVSQFQHERTKPYNPAPASFDAYLTNPDPVSISKYYFQLARYLNGGFEREQVQVVIFEELVSQPAQVMAQVTRFLGIEDLPRWRLPHLNQGARDDLERRDPRLTRAQYHALLHEIKPQLAEIEELLGRKIPLWDLSERRWCR
jgi:hypothetical protein